MEKDLPFEEFIRKLDKITTYNIPEGYIEVKRNAKQDKATNSIDKDSDEKRQ